MKDIHEELEDAEQTIDELLEALEALVATPQYAPLAETSAWKQAREAIRKAKGE